MFDISKKWIILLWASKAGYIISGIAIVGIILGVLFNILSFEMWFAIFPLILISSIAVSSYASKKVMGQFKQVQKDFFEDMNQDNPFEFDED